MIRLLVLTFLWICSLSLFASEEDELCLKQLAQAIIDVRELAIEEQPYVQYELTNQELTALERLLKEDIENGSSLYANNSLINEFFEYYQLRTSYEIEAVKGRKDIIYIFGTPFVDEEEIYVHFKLWRIGLIDEVGAKDRVLRKMPFDHFYEYIKDEFFTWTLQIDDIVLQKINGEYRTYTYRGHKDDMAFLIDENGNEASVTKKKLLFFNYMISKAEKKFLNAFFKNAGEGKVHFVQEVSIDLNGHYGIYIEPSKLPAYQSLSKEAAILFHNKKSYISINNLVFREIPILLSTTEHGLRAGYAPESSFFSEHIPTTKQGHFVFTKWATEFDIAHELKHKDDHFEGIVKAYRDDFKVIDLRYKNYDIPSFVWEDFERYIKEQRAYSLQRRLILEEVKANPNQNFDYPRKPKIKTIEDYYQHFITEDRITFYQAYAIPMKRSLSVLKSIDPKIFNDAIGIIKKNIERDDYFNSTAPML